MNQILHQNNTIFYKDIDLHIDTIRVYFSKELKIQKLKSVGNWHKLKKSDYHYQKLKKRLDKKELASVYLLENESIYFYQTKDNYYRSCRMIFYGLEQYHKPKPNIKLIKEILSILTYKAKDLSIVEIDLCYDTYEIPNIKALSEIYQVNTYLNSYYIENIPFVKRLNIYDKQFKNSLNFQVFRYEFTIQIPNFKDIYLPLDTIQEVINLCKNSHK